MFFFHYHINRRFFFYSLHVECVPSLWTRRNWRIEWLFFDFFRLATQHDTCWTLSEQSWYATVKSPPPDNFHVFFFFKGGVWIFIFVLTRIKREGRAHDWPCTHTKQASHQKPTKPRETGRVQCFRRAAQTRIILIVCVCVPHRFFFSGLLFPPSKKIFFYFIVDLLYILLLIFIRRMGTTWR